MRLEHYRHYKISSDGLTWCAAFVSHVNHKLCASGVKRWFYHQNYPDDGHMCVLYSVSKQLL